MPAPATGEPEALLPVGNRAVFSPLSPLAVPLLVSSPESDLFHGGCCSRPAAASPVLGLASRRLDCPTPISPSRVTTRSSPSAPTRRRVPAWRAWKIAL